MKSLLNCSFVAAALLAIQTSSNGQTLKVSLDGIYTGADSYSNSMTVTWYNGHNKGSIYGDFAHQTFTTTLRYGVAELVGGTPGQKFFFMFTEVPLYAKNMIWGSGPTADDWKYYGGKVLDYNAATGSEKLDFLDSKGAIVYTADFGALADKTFGNIGFKDSVDYLIDNKISTLASSVARNTTMSFELQFAVDSVKNQQLLNYAKNGFSFHLSPERTAPVPEPSSTILTGLLSAAFLFRRKR